MEPSAQQHETPDRGEARELVEPGSVSRFTALAKRLFAVKRKDFEEALRKDEEERRDRRAKRGRSR